uniref:Toll-like receptor 13 n=1 Tax=Pelusios castaneus TaxID=367368 RepID=A0A8C8SQN7_9SAUR
MPQPLALPLWLLVAAASIAWLPTTTLWLNLVLLNLTQNRLAALGPVALVELTGLQVLYLGYNALVTLHPAALRAQVQLQELHLPHNHLSQLQEVAVAASNLRNLSLLDLDSNQISAPCPGPRLLSMPFLRHLNLRGNSITWLDLTNCSLPSLRSLNLTRNNMTQLEATSFRATPGLVELVLDENPLNISQLLGLSLLNLTTLRWSSIQLGACTNLTQLDLSTSPLSQLDKGIFHSFSQLESLTLDKCKAKQLKQSAWGRSLPRLQVLILRRNQLTKLEDAVFHPLSGLTQLDLSRNRLTYVYKKTFLGMASLRSLSLQGCQLAKLNHLRTLLLTGNHILTLKKGAFKGLTSLRHLSLAQNGLYKLSKGSFLGLKAVQTLDLSRNRLLAYGKYDLPAPFTSLLALQQLDLSSQEARPPIKLPPKLFQGLGKLQELSLRDNPSDIFLNLSLAPLASLLILDLADIYPSRGGPFSLPPGLFGHLGNLERLRLDSSSLWDLPEKVFSGLASLKWLSLRENRLQNISQGLLANLPSLRYLDATGNPLACSCDNAWFQNWSAAEPSIQVALLGSYFCLGPGMQEGVDRGDSGFTPGGGCSQTQCCPHCHGWMTGLMTSS